MRRLRRFATVLLTAVAALSITVGSAAAATSDSYYGHLHQDGSLTWFTSIQRYHSGGSMSVRPNNGPNANGAMRMGLARQVNGVWTQFTASVAIDHYSNYVYGFWDMITLSSYFSARWFIIDARMVDACGIFCDDDFGGAIYYSGT